MTPCSTTICRTAAVALTILLAGCGGFTAVDIGGTVSGLASTGLVLKNGTDSVSPAVGATTFVFPMQVAIRAPYAVTIGSQPARQTCQLFNSSGIAGASPVTIVAVICTTNTYNVGGTVAGLTVGTNLVLTNGSDRVTIAAGDASGNATFVFPTKVADAAAYGVEVLQQPAGGQSCSVVRPTGSAIVNMADVNSVKITCS